MLTPSPAADASLALRRDVQSAAVAAFALLPVVFSGTVLYSFFTPKVALLLVLLGLGAPLLLFGPRLGLAERRLAIAFLSVAALSTALNDQPLLSLFGHANSGRGLIWLLALASCWALGRHLDDPMKRRLQLGLVSAACLNVCIATLQVTTDLSPYGLPLYNGAAPTGLLGNPVHVGAFSAASVVIAATAVRRTPPMLAIVLLLAFGGSLSGSRSTQIVLLVAVVWAARLLGGKKALAVVAIAVIGASASQLLSHEEGTTSVASRASEGRIADPGERIEVWREASPAFLDRPVLGRGPARFAEATSPHRTELHGKINPDVYNYDAHNAFFEYLVTTGLLGTVTLGGWLLLSSWRAAGPFLGFATALAVFHLLQPHTVGITPLAMMALGASKTGSMPRRPMPPRWILPVGAMVGVLLAAALLGGTFAARQTRLTFDDNDAELARALLPPWPELSTVRAQPALLRATMGTESQDVLEARQWLTEATERSPDLAWTWAQLAGFEYNNGRYADAERLYRQALERDPWSRKALKGLAEIEAATGDIDGATNAYAEIVKTWPNDRHAARRLAELQDSSSGIE